MKLWQTLIRMLMCVAFFAAPLSASATPHHNAQVSASFATHNGSAQKLVQTVNSSTAIQFAHTPVPVDHEQNDRDCDDCCFASCAKHLTALPASNFAFVPTRKTLQTNAVVQVVRDGRDIDPDRKPPRI